MARKRKTPHEAAPTDAAVTERMIQQPQRGAMASQDRVTTPPLSTPVPANTPKFIDLAKDGSVHPTLLETLTNDLKFDHMMPVQAATLPHLLQGNDCLGQAKTGTGKTIAFLLPAIQKMITNQQRPKASISLLVLSPTRELALQIAKEAEKLVQRLQNYRVKVAIGGTNKNTEAKSLQQGCEILIATPGRLLDHLSDGQLGRFLASLQTLVLDEADRMLDMGFLPDVKRILGFLPSKVQVPRQSMLFSATIEGKIQEVAHLILNDDYKFITTIAPGEVNAHERVPQHLAIVPSMVDMVPAMKAVLLKERRSSSPFKAIVFATTAAQADFYAHILKGSQDLPTVFALHSRLSQSRRTNLTAQFREAKDAVCVATDVIARGMDFPNVSHVIQIGIPSDKAAYVHRLGRTARADAEGTGIMVLAKPEEAFLYQVKDVKFETYHLPPYGLDSIAQELNSFEGKEKVYQAWLGYYKSYMKTMKWSAEELVQQANTFALQGLGCPEVPGLQKSTIGKMGLKGVRGLVVRPNDPGSVSRRTGLGRPGAARGADGGDGGRQRQRTR